MWYLLTFALFGLLVAVFRYHWNRRKLYKIAMQCDGPWALPLVGNAHIFNCDQKEIFDKITEIVDYYKQPLRFWLGPKLLLILSDLSHVERILSSTKISHKSDIYVFINYFVEDGLVTGSGEIWKSHRRLIQPMLNLKYMTYTMPIMQKHTDVLMDNLEKKVNKGTFDVLPYLNCCLFDLIGEILFGVTVDSQLGKNMDHVKILESVYMNAFERMVKPWLYPDVLHRISSNHSERNKIKIQLDLFCDMIIDRSIERVQKSYDNDVASIIDKIIKYMMDNPNAMTRSNLRAEILTIYEASQDTITFVSSMCVYCFGMYPEYQELAAEEIHDVFGDVPRAVEECDLPKLKYLERCIKDVLRLVPIAPFILRKATEEIIVGNLSIPTGCEVLVPIFNIHRNPAQFENPHHFYPDHFLEDAVAKRHPFAYVPFSAGPRNCIGKFLAMTNLKLILANLLQRFRFEADGKVPDMRFRSDISIRSLDGYKVRVFKRTWS